MLSSRWETRRNRDKIHRWYWDQDEDDHDKTEGFWREFFLLKPDKATLHKILLGLNPDDLLHLQVWGCGGHSSMPSWFRTGADTAIVLEGGRMHQSRKCSSRCSRSWCRMRNIRGRYKADKIDYYGLSCICPSEKIYESKLRYNKCPGWFRSGWCHVHGVCGSAGRHHKNRQEL